MASRPELAPMNTDNAHEQIARRHPDPGKGGRQPLAPGRAFPEEYARLLKAAGEVFQPDPRQKRLFVKTRIREHKAEKMRREEQLLHQTGIRELRRRPVFITPNPLPAPAIEPREVENDPDFRDAIEPQHCYICKRHYSAIHHFYDQLCPECADLNFRKRTELADLTRARRPADRRAREDRLPGGHQAAALGRPSDRDDPLPARLRGPLRAGARLAQWGHRLEIFGLDLRHTRVWRPFAGT